MGMKVWITSCSASTPRPLLALPATSGTTRPAAAARCSAASISGRGTFPSCSTYASMSSSSVAERASSSCSRSPAAHEASSRGTASPPTALGSSRPMEHSMAEQTVPSSTFSNKEPVFEPLAWTGAKSTTGRAPKRSSKLSTAASKSTASSEVSTPFKKTTMGLCDSSTALNMWPDAAPAPPPRTEQTTTAPWATRRASSTCSRRST
mmetsp:Transcript_26035/g.74657  ORF Transcript_26035/g.74657 Transcript_26035/m.74657 type:complete len:207 (+) Transcript_26035:1449-2069(+)